MAPRPSGILQAPRVVLVVVFPMLNFILYLILSLGCSSTSLSDISPVIARTNSPINIGGQDTVVDLRVGFYGTPSPILFVPSTMMLTSVIGICLGPAPLFCTSSSSILNPKRESDLARSIPLSKGGGNFALAGLALSLQSSFIVLSGFPLLLSFIASILANMIQIYFSQGMIELHAKAALWARSLDWAAAAGAVMGFSAYQSIVAAAPRLIRVLMSGAMVDISVGGTASSLFAGVVALTILGAVINTLLTGGDVGFDAFVAGKTMGKQKTRAGGQVGDRGRMSRMFVRRPAYEVFP
ncbi:hypothetical protein QC761_711040 [Podospora bellae-mahoneyi]|uniref:Uncharacterized protein n=1 Tax=Podospora bellae-mahoneyi TaxID=2093777 RepID=A0ABR0FAI7_9PEZI|nr:hypothetical protein QC761_711040 [Podospora bellae-mahoneyi]